MSIKRCFPTKSHPVFWLWRNRGIEYIIADNYGESDTYNHVGNLPRSFVRILKENSPGPGKPIGRCGKIVKSSTWDFVPVEIMRSTIFI